MNYATISADILRCWKKRREPGIKDLIYELTMKETHFTAGWFKVMCFKIAKTCFKNCPFTENLHKNI